MNDDEFLRDISSSLAEQVQEELENNPEDDRKSMAGKKRKKKKKYIVLKLFLGLLVTLLLGGVFLTFTPVGRRIISRLAVEYMYGKMETPKKQVKPASSSAVVVGEEEELKVGEITDNIDMSVMSDTFKNALHEEGVYNILLLGVEAIGSGSTAAGRTDSIMIATVNTKQKTLGLTSLMRDTYLNIPGYYSGRINGVYNQGGVALLYEVIAHNYGIRLDGSAIVSFDTFQQVIDDLGGVDIEITADEAKYLNRTNYISNKANRNLKAGVNHMNGNQALGYARVRYVATLDGAIDDMGRTSRHRRVMSAIFAKMKKSSPAQLIKMMNTVFSKVQTDIKKDNAGSYLAELVELSIAGVPLDNLRLPEDGAYRGIKVNGASVIDVDWVATKQALINFVFTPHEKAEETAKGENKTTGN